MHARSLRPVLVLLMSLVLSTAIGCSSKQDAPPEEPSVPAPASSPLSKIKEGMTDGEVRAAIGNPDAQHSYMTGKSWIPYYGSFAGDTSRSEWRYRGQGKITFTHARWSSQMKVIRVIYDPNEKGV